MHPEIPPAPPSPGPVTRWDAIIVAGGRAKRLGGIDKTALVWHGRSLLAGVLRAADAARRICVVGSDADLPASVLRTVERPRWGGPAAAIVTGLDALAGSPGAGSHASARQATPRDDGTDTAADWVVVLAGDLVRADDAVAELLAELGRSLSEPRAGAEPDPVVDGLISVDAGGRRQPLLAVYRRAALASSARLLGPAENLSVTSLIGGLNLVELHLGDALSDDVDTPADAARLGIVLPPPATGPKTP